MKRNRKAKILATLGPVSSSNETIERIFKAGCDVFRLNFSHGSVETHRQNLEWIRQLEEKYNHATCILADLQGPKLRVGEFKNIEESLKKGQKFILDTDSKLGDNERVNFPHSEIYDHLTPNTTLLINDGRIRLQIIEQNKDSLITEVLNDGVISNNKGVNIPDVILPIDSLTSKDKADLQKALEMNVDWVALSFVQQAEDIHKLKKIVDGKALVMAKIEKPSAVKNIDDIIQAADGIMIARGDLGVEMPTEKVPIAQKNIIKRCRHYGKPVVVATQMLESMISNLVPTRAEASDVANAIYDGTDAVMLSGETSVGEHPFEAVRVMGRIAEDVEQSNLLKPRDLSTIEALSGPSHTVARCAAMAVQESDRPLVVFTWSGRSAVLASKARMAAPIFALTPDERVCDALALVWGITAVRMPVFESTDEMIAAGERVLIDQGYIQPGTEVVVLAGNSPMRGATNLMKVEVFGDA